MIDNFWYVGCPSSQLLGDKPLGTQIGEHRIVLFRDSGGRATALLDRCSHRGFPLSRSGLIDGRLKCSYHGWEYDSSGCCVCIPSQSVSRPIPERFSVTSFPCEERDGYVWVWIGAGEPRELEGIVQLSGGQWLQGQMIIQCNYLRALEITFDMCHVPFVHPLHPATIRASEAGLVPTRYELRGTKDGCVLFTPPTKSECEPIPEHAFKLDFRLPGAVHFTIPSLSKLLHFMYFYVTPLSERSCRMDWLVSNTSTANGADAIHWHGEGTFISQEDREVLESVEQTYALEGCAFEKSVEADAPTLALRQIVRAAERGLQRVDTVSKVRRRVLLITTVPR